MPQAFALSRFRALREGLFYAAPPPLLCRHK